jgi:hypothetical protein
LEASAAESKLTVWFVKGNVDEDDCKIVIVDAGSDEVTVWLIPEKTVVVEIDVKPRTVDVRVTALLQLEGEADPRSVTTYVEEADV